MQLTAVRRQGEAIKCIHNPSKAVQLAAIKECGYAIQYIHNPSEEVIRYVIENCNDEDIIQSMRINFEKLPDDLKLRLEIM